MNSTVHSERSGSPNRALSDRTTAGIDHQSWTQRWAVYGITWALLLILLAAVMAALTFVGR